MQHDQVVLAAESSRAGIKPLRFKRLRTLAAFASGALVSGGAAAQESDIELETLKVEDEVTPDTNPYAEPGAPYLGKRSADPRRTRPLAEIPQTITVLTGTQIEETGRSDLKEILDGQPGITLGTGEGGNAFGDRYIIRGHEARSDMFVDGIRDPGMTIRESFAVEQLEITKGPSATFAGRGSTGGAVNAITKRASTEFDFTKVSAGGGADEYRRFTLDTNQAFSPSSAVRVNLLSAYEGVPDRSPADRDRLGAAVSWNLSPSDQMEIATDLYYLDAEDKPDMGTYLPHDGAPFAERVFGAPVADAPAYLQDEDFLVSTVSAGTIRVGYELSPDFRLVNLARYGTTENEYLVTLASWQQTVYPTEADALADSNAYHSARLRAQDGWQEVEYFGNQFSLLADVQTGSVSHEMIFGLEYTDQSVLNGRIGRNPTGDINCWRRQGSIEGNDLRGTPAHCMFRPNGEPVDSLNSLLMRDVVRGDWDSDWNMETISASIMDTVDLTDQLTVFGGVRFDSFDYFNEAFTRRVPDSIEYRNSDDFWNGHLGATWHLSPIANIYAGFSTATNLNGGESDVGSNCGYGGVCAVIRDNENNLIPPVLGDPEQTQNIEVGTKWLFGGGKLLATAAVFQITKSDVMESTSASSYDAFGSLNTGENRVQGFEFGLSGNLTDRLSVQAGLALMQSEVLKSITALDDNPNNDTVGKPLANFAENSASLHLKYQVTPRFSFGGTATYESERYGGQPDAGVLNQTLAVPAYSLLDVFATYNFRPNLRLRFNVSNITDEDHYLVAYRSGGFVYLGDGRNIRLTLQGEF